MDKPKVSICVPSPDVWKTSMAMSMAIMMHRLGRTDVVRSMFCEQCSDIALARNGLVMRARGEGATHIFWADSDNSFPDHTLETLLAHDKDVVGCFYSTRTPPYQIVGQLVNQDDWERGGLSPAKQIPGGCVLVRMSVYDRILETCGLHPYEEWFDPAEATETNPLGFVSDDTCFTRRALQAGCEVFCDIDLSEKIGHSGSTTNFIAPRYLAEQLLESKCG